MAPSSSSYPPPPPPNLILLLLLLLLFLLLPLLPLTLSPSSPPLPPLPPPPPPSQDHHHHHHQHYYHRHLFFRRKISILILNFGSVWVSRVWLCTSEETSDHSVSSVTKSKLLTLPKPTRSFKAWSTYKRRGRYEKRPAIPIFGLVEW